MVLYGVRAPAHRSLADVSSAISCLISLIAANFSRLYITEPANSRATLHVACFLLLARANVLSHARAVRINTET
jgi:hypothetical protein